VAGVFVELPGETAGEVLAAAQAYPTLRGVRIVKAGTRGEWADNDDAVEAPSAWGRRVVSVNLPIDNPTTYERLSAAQRSLASVVELGEKQNTGHQPEIGYALPELAGGDSPHPLMLWWALLLGLSSYARYEPAAWTAALDLDRSELAAGLEGVLDLAAVRVPERVLDSLLPA
jgi:hypothetical protein